MAGGMSASAELFADVAGRDIERRVYGIQQGRLACSGVAGKGADLAGEEVADALDRALVRVVHFKCSYADRLVDLAYCRRIAEVGLGDDDYRLDALEFRYRDEFVEDKEIRRGANCRDDEYYLVKVCKGWSYEVIPAPGDLGDDSSAELYPVAYCRTYTLCAENSPRFAFIYTVRGLHCVESP